MIFGRGEHVNLQLVRSNTNKVRFDLNLIKTRHF